LPSGIFIPIGVAAAYKKKKPEIRLLEKICFIEMIISVPVLLLLQAVVLPVVHCLSWKRR